jgi:hypothetical protein
MFGSYKLVARRGANVFDVVDEKGVGERLLDEKDYLSTARGESFDHFSAYARCTALYLKLAQSRSLPDHIRLPLP